jgi:hypothetical protein
MKNLIVTVTLMLLCLLTTLTALAAPIMTSPNKDEAMEPPRKARCYTGEFIFADDGQIEMVGCSLDQSQLLFLKVGELFVTPRINPDYNLLIRAGIQPTICGLKPGERLTENLCWHLFPVYKTRAGTTSVVPTMVGKFVSGRAYSFLNKEDQVEGEKKRRTMY